MFWIAPNLAFPTVRRVEQRDYPEGDAAAGALPGRQPDDPPPGDVLQRRQQRLCHALPQGASQRQCW